MLNFNGKVITLTKSYFDTDEGKIFLENLKNTSSNPNFKNTNSKNTIKVKVDTYTQIENAIYKLLESINNTIDIPQINIPTEEIFKELEMLKNKLYCFTIQYIDPNPGQENKSLTKENQEELKPTSLPHKLSICTDNIKKLQTYYSVLSKEKQKYLSRVNTFKKMNNDDNLERAQALYQLHADILDNVKPVLKREDSNTHSMNDYELYSRVARPLWDILES